MGAIVVFICEHKIVKHFDGQSAVHSRTREMHREFHRALMAMVSKQEVLQGKGKAMATRSNNVVK